MRTLHGAILRYTLLPGFVPRLGVFFFTGFAHIAYLIAVIYQALRLLPPSHPYLNPQNIGRFGIRHVIAEAANNLVFSRKNIDQIFVFATMLVGLMLLFVQFALLLLAIFTQPALAGLISANDVLKVTSIFAPAVPGHPAQDLAFIILDRVFGMVGIFNSCVAQVGVDCLGGFNDMPVSTPVSYPLPWHIALHTLLRFYSLGIFAVSVFIILYFIAAITAETAETGTPFGQRFNKTWVPFRLIVFFALLVPLNIGQANEGLNAAQLVTFWTAKTGSNFATNAWGRFNQQLEAAAGGNTSLLGDPDTLIAIPKVPEVRALAQFMFVAKTCQIAEEWAYDHGGSAGGGIKAYIVRNEQQNPLVTSVNAVDFLSTPFGEALKFSAYGDIIVRFGAHDENNTAFHKYEGNVFPYCGEIKITVPAQDPANTTGSAHSGAYAAQELYYDLLQQMWTSSDAAAYGECIVKFTYQKAQDPQCPSILDKNFRLSQINNYENFIGTNLPAIVQQHIDNGEWNIPDRLKAKGWAGVALWYNRIAEMNGSLASSIINLPQPYKYPFVMEVVSKKRRMLNENVSSDAAFDPVFADGENIKFPRDADKQIAASMYSAYLGWDDARKETKNQGMIVDAINLLFGTQGIFDMRKNADQHPLAQLTALGRSMMDASIRNLGFGYAGSALAKALGIEGSAAKATAVATDFAKIIGTTSLAMSFLLYYVLPILPFIYFIFAVSGWVKSIFEAIVAMPLWALAHIIRIDGEGLPGPAATNGYFLLLEIFIRPVLILFGLLASITIFSAMVKVLNSVFELLVSNVSGVNDPGLTDFLRGPVDEFLYTAMYVIICYMIGMSCFKLIDAIPNQILRWAGVSTSTFGENAGFDPASELSSKVYGGIQVGTGQISGGALAAL